jgi:hypothetical protein
VVSRAWFELLWNQETLKSKVTERQKELELVDYEVWATKELEDDSGRDMELLVEPEAAETDNKMLEEGTKYVVSIMDWIKKGAEVKEEKASIREQEINMEIGQTVQQLEEDLSRSRRLQKSRFLKEEWMTRRKELMAAKRARRKAVFAKNNAWARSRSERKLELESMKMSLEARGRKRKRGRGSVGDWTMRLKEHINFWKQNHLKTLIEEGITFGRSPYYTWAARKCNNICVCKEHICVCTEWLGKNTDRAHLCLKINYPKPVLTEVTENN